MQRRSRPAEERFWEKVEKRADGCWVWIAGRDHDGYGSFWNGAKGVRAHRFSYELLVGPIPDGLQPDHLCRNRACVNPAHLEPVTVRENLLRGQTHAAHNAAKTHCKRGHPLSGDNLYVYPSGERSCRECHRLANRDQYRASHGVPPERFRAQ